MLKIIGQGQMEKLLLVNNFLCMRPRTTWPRSRQNRIFFSQHNFYILCQDQQLVPFKNLFTEGPFLHQFLSNGSAQLNTWPSEHKIRLWLWTFPNLIAQLLTKLSYSIIPQIILLNWKNDIAKTNSYHHFIAIVTLWLNSLHALLLSADMVLTVCKTSGLI